MFDALARRLIESEFETFGDAVADVEVDTLGETLLKRAGRNSARQANKG